MAKVNRENHDKGGIMMEESTRTIRFYRNDGTKTFKTKVCPRNQLLGSLPKVHRDGFLLIGWFTSPDAGYGTKCTEDTMIDEDMVLYAHWYKSKRKRSQTKDTWTNDDKDQIHLGLGSDEYHEYLKDLQEHHPLKPHDAVSQDHLDFLVKLNEKPNQRQSLLTNRTHNELLKRSEILKAVSSLTNLVFHTVDQSDDERLGTMRGNNEIVSSLVNNPSKSIDEMVEDTKDYILYGHQYW